MGDAPSPIDDACEAFERGDLEEAIAAARANDPGVDSSGEALNAIGTAFAKRGRTEAARRAYEAAAEADPSLHKPHANLAKLAKEAGDAPAAIAALRRATELAPTEARLWARLGSACAEAGDLPGALVAHTRASELEPSDDALVRVAAIEVSLGDFEAAWTRLRALRGAGALKLRAKAAIGRAKAVALAGDFDRALAIIEDERATQPEDRALTFSAADLRATMGDAQKVMPLLDRNAESVIDFLALLGFELNAGAWSPRERLARHVAWADRFAPPAPAICRPWTPARPARLRVAFLSGDLFPAHAVLRFARPAIFGLDPARFEVFCFETHVAGRWNVGDAVTFRDVSNLREDQVAKAIAADDIHVVIDLSGYTVHSGLVALRHRPAPIQASWLGYPATTGLRTIDYRITDALVDPAPTAEAEYLETVLRLPRTAWCFPFSELPPPVERVGAVRFGSVNRAAKVSDDTLAAWAAVLSGAPGTSLVIKGRGFASRFARARVEEAMRRAHVDLDRVEISGWTNDVQDHFRAFGDFDVVLDTSPYAGTTTTCEALGSGVPVVTLAGDTHVSRVGVSLLSQVGLEDLVATSWSDYVERAIRLANDAPRRAELRRTLRATCEASPLGDAERFAKDFGDGIDAMWAMGPRERP